VKVFCALALPIAAAPSPTRACLETWLAPEAGQSVELLGQNENYVAASAAISAVWATTRNIFFSSEMDDSVPPTPGGDKDSCFI